MKRKVKFQEGGAVEAPGQRRVRLSESFRDRDAEFRDRMRQAARERMAQRRLYGSPSATAEVNRFNERMNRAMPITPEEARSLGAEPAQRPANPRPNVPGRAAAAAGTVARGASRLIPGMNVLRELAPTSLEAGAEFERAGLAQARQDALMRERAAMEQELAEAPQRMPTPRPTPRPRPAAAAAPREISADRLNDLMMGAEPANAEERIAQMRMQGRRQELEERGTAFKKGGMVKPKAKPVAKKAGGMIAAKPKAAPKKMMKGGVVAKPKSKAKPMAKPMPFKKGGAIKKGRK